MRRVFAWMAMLLVAGFCLSAASGGYLPAQSLAGEGRSEAGALQSPEEGQLYIAILKESPVLERLGQKRSGRIPGVQAMTSGPEGASLRRAVEDGQTSFRTRIDSLLSTRSAVNRLEWVGSTSFLINAVFLKTDPEVAATVAEDSSVERIVLSRPRYPVMDYAPELLGATQLWNQLGGSGLAGQGVKIGVIDSGINQNHPMLRGDGLSYPGGFPKGDATYTNTKVIVARTYYQFFPSPPTAASDRTPEDQLGHGSKVAGIVAGQQTQAEYAQVSGIAPMAYLGNYKVFGRGVNATTTSTAIIAALDQAVADGMQVLNLSLGGPAYPPEQDPEQEAIRRAVEAGVIVVVAAGNEGPDAATVTSPGTSPHALTVGSVEHSRTFSPALTVSGVGVPSELTALPYTPGAGVSITAAVGPAPLTWIGFLDPSEEACSPLGSGALKGRIALVRRGTCLFQVKADNVFDAGATALVVYNNAAGASPTMSFTNVRGPSVMIPKDSGEGLRDFLRTSHYSSYQARIGADSQLARFLTPGNMVSSFSGRGPNIDGSIKPDIMAIGSNVYTSTSVTGQYTTTANGTSFSTPMVAGAAALLRQLHPQWTVAELKSALVNTASKTPTLDGLPAHVMQMGNGRLDLVAAGKTTASLDPVSISFGFLDENFLSEGSTFRELALTNLSGTTRTFQVSYQAAVDNPGLQVSVDQPSLVIPAGNTGTVQVMVHSAGQSVGGYFEGFIHIYDPSGGQELTAPIWGAAGFEDPSVVWTVKQDGSGDFASLSAAIDAAQPGNIIEIDDDGVYAYSGTITNNSQGLPLNGLTIRAGQGHTPVIDGSGLAGNGPVITIEGLDRVRFEGVHILGGLQGIQFNSGGGTVMNSTIEGSPDSGTGYGLSLVNGYAHVFGNQFLNVGGAAISSVASEALIQGNRIGDGTRGTIAGHGMLFSSSDGVAAFDNEILSPGDVVGYQGIRVSSSSALIKGNLISDSGGIDGDGIAARSSLSKVEIIGNSIVGSKRYGLSFTDSAQAWLSGNSISANSSAGINLAGKASVEGSRLSLFNNSNGVIATDSTFKLSNALVDRSATYGIRGTNTTLQLFNNTIFGSGGPGVSAESPVQTTAVNNVLFENSPDASGLSGSGVSYNLSGDGQLGSTPPNLAGDPGLTDPVSGDFLPRSGSPVVDRGNNAAVIGTLDLAGHQRVVDGNGDGQKVVDFGALESGSGFSTPLYVPLMADGSRSFQGVALHDARPASGYGYPSGSAEIEWKAFSSTSTAGSGPSMTGLQPGSQDARLVNEILGQFGAGWVQIRSSRPGLLGFTLTGDYSLSKLDGLTLPTQAAAKWILPEIRTSSQFTTRIYLLNPNVETVTVTLTWRGVQQSKPATTQIPGQSLVEASAAALFPGVEGGYLQVETAAATPILAFEKFENPQALACLAGLPAENATPSLYGAQLAATNTVDTTISFVNLGSGDTVTLEAISESGIVVATEQGFLAQNAQFRATASETFHLTDFVGWLRVTSAAAKLVGSISFGSPDGNTLAALPLQASTSREFVLSHIAQTDGVFTGITILNPLPEPALVSIEAFAPDGIRKGISLQRLEAGHKRALLLPEWIPSLTEQAGGFIRVRANRGIVGFELFGSANYLAAVPQQDVTW